MLVIHGKFNSIQFCSAEERINYKIYINTGCCISTVTLVFINKSKSIQDYFQLTICRPPQPLRNGQIYIKDIRAATYEKSIFRFLFFELWSILITNF